MLVERLQVMVALGHRVRAVRISIPFYALYIAAAGLVLLLVGGGLAGRALWFGTTEQGRLERLTGENYRLKSRIVRYQAAMDTFRTFLAVTEEMDNRLRAASGLELIPTDLRKVGVGGNPIPGEDASVDHLLRRTRYQERSLNEIERAITSQADRLARIPSIWPVQGWVTSSFGHRRDPFTGRTKFHDGIDIVAPYGARIVAAADGKVTYAGWKDNWGRVVEIDHGNGLRTFYAHCQSVSAAVGDSVKRGQVIARLGSSGRSTGAHLHYGVRRKGAWVNPANHIISN
ncbi:MAG: M23 family metallopeptidase [bacterium]